MSKNLLPCPFCGGEPSMVSEAGNRHYIRCLSCDQQFEQSDEESAARAWNRRTSPNSIQGSLTQAMGDVFDMRPSYAGEWFDYLKAVGDAPPHEFSSSPAIKTQEK